MKILSSEYVKSFTEIRHFNLPVLPTIAFIGRSNVGKSSLINHLLNRKKLVKTSSTPGKTQLLNYFLINNTFYFVDLPGYGFANVPIQVKDSWQKIIEDFIVRCPELLLTLQLVDARHKPSKEDIAFREMVRGRNLNSIVVANKIDKVKKSQIQKLSKQVQKVLELPQPPLIHSTLKKIGKEKIWNIINGCLDEDHRQLT